MKRRIAAAVMACFAVLVYAESAPLPDTYRSVSLGMDMDTVKEQLKNDGMFGYRGDRDVSLLHGETAASLKRPVRPLLHAHGFSFMKTSSMS